MKDEIRRELEKAIATDKTKLEALNTEQTEKANAKLARETQWNDQIKSVLVPGPQEMAATINKAGWICKVEAREKVLVVNIHRGDMRAAARTGRPELRFEMDGGGMIAIYQATVGRLRRYHAYNPEQVNIDFVEARVLKFFQALAMK